VDETQTPLAGVLALLFRIETDTPAGVPVAQMITDEDGHFAFGGLDGGELYRVKVFLQGGAMRVVEAQPGRTEPPCRAAR